MTQSDPHAPDAGFPLDSPTSETDAGLDDPIVQDFDAEILKNQIGDLDADLPASPEEEISLPYLDVESLDDPVTRDTIRSPEMSDLNVPGEIDIEALGDDDIADSLPPDARLDPLEE